MEVQAFDPFVSAAVAEQAHVKLRSLDELLQTSDYLTLHTTLTKETKHLLGKDAFARVKAGVRIVNAARGELIDDDALLAALDSGRVAGAALDVHAQEPPKDWRLAKHPKVLALPHLGASTKEAQERVGTDIAQQVRDYLKGGVIQQAVNFYSLAGDLYDRVRPAMDLAERLGLFLAQACRGSLERIELGVYGDLRELDLEADPLGGGHRRPPAAHGRGRHARERGGHRAGAGDRDPRVDLLGLDQLREPRGAAPQDERGGPVGRGDGLRRRAPAARGRGRRRGGHHPAGQRAAGPQRGHAGHRGPRRHACSAPTASTSRAWASAASRAAAGRSC